MLNNRAKFYRVGYDSKSLYRDESTVPEDYDLTVELILRNNGLGSKDTSIVKYAENMPDNAQKAYTNGVIKSGGLAQLSMFFKPYDKIYFVSNLIGKLARKVNIDDSDLILMAGLHSIVVSKCLRQVIEAKSKSYKKAMIDLYTAIGGNKILGYGITGGMTIQQAFSDQINAPKGVPSPDDKVLLAEMYMGYISKNLTRNKTKTQKMIEKVWRYVSSLLNLRLMDAELEGLIRSALEHRRSTAMT